MKTIIMCALLAILATSNGYSQLVDNPVPILYPGNADSAEVRKYGQDPQIRFWMDSTLLHNDISRLTADIAYYQKLRAFTVIMEDMPEDVMYSKDKKKRDQYRKNAYLKTGFRPKDTMFTDEVDQQNSCQMRDALNGMRYDLKEKQSEYAAKRKEYLAIVKQR